MAQRGDLKWGTVDHLKELIEQYFSDCKKTDEAPNIAGLCLALDICKDTFNYYANGRYEERLAITAREQKQELIEAIGEDGLQEHIIENDIYLQLPIYYTDDKIDAIKADVSANLKSARTRLEKWVWANGFTAKNPAMAIFTLKAVHGYTDQPQEVSLHQNNLNLNIKIEQIPQKQPTIIVSED